MKLLIVEDVPEMAELIHLTLEDVPGLDLLPMAQTGVAALMVAERERPDLVFLDRVLPGESSDDLAKELRQRGIRVVFVTGEGMPAEEQIGGIPILKKPSWDTIQRDRPAYIKFVRERGRTLPLK